jgi:hypothetical protein
MRTDNVTIHKFEYRGYKVEIIEGAGYVKGSYYCYSYKSDKSNSFSCDNKNPADLDEMIEYVKKELDKRPVFVPQKPYDKADKIDITKDVESKRRSIINEFEKQYFKETELVKWVIELPAECFDIKNCDIHYFPRLFQCNTPDHYGYEIWFKCTIIYKETDREILDYLVKTFKKFDFKPVYNNLSYMDDTFDLCKNSYFTSETNYQIRTDHPMHGNKQVSFYLNPDYAELILGNIDQPPNID